MAQLKARLAREAREAEIAEICDTRKTAVICSIEVHEDLKTLSSHESPTGPKLANGNKNGIGEVSTLAIRSPKSSESVKSVIDKNDESGLEDGKTLDDDAPTLFGYNDLDFDDCHITEVIKFLQKIAKSSDVSKLNMAFTK